MRTRPATLTTVAIALGLALTAMGVARQLPYTFAGHGDRSTVSADVWAHGTAISPAVVALVFLGLLATVAMRPTRGGRRAALWLGILAGAVSLAGLAEPAQQTALLFGRLDELTAFAWAFHASLLGVVLSCLGEVRRANVTPGSGIDEGEVPEDGEPVAAGRRLRLAGLATA